MEIKGLTEHKYPGFIWVDIFNPSAKDLDLISERYGLDGFHLKDSMEIGHLPKFERITNYDFFILRAFTEKPGKSMTTVKELSNKIAFFYNAEILISIHRAPFEFLNEVSREFVSTQALLLSITSTMIDSYRGPAQLISDKVDQLEEKLFLRGQDKIASRDIYFQISQTRISKKLLMVSQTVLNHLEVENELKSALQDIKDNIFYLILLNDEILEDSQNLLNTYLSVSAQKTGEVMKMLTIFSAFFLPLTFIVGIYGMNFKYMPELGWANGYYMSLALMLAVCLIIFIWFKRKKIL